MLDQSVDKVLEAHRLSKEVSSPEGTLTILNDVSFNIDAGETVAVVGASGAGKSTLLALLAGLDLPTRGHVDLNGKNLSTLDEDGRFTWCLRSTRWKTSCCHWNSRAMSRLASWLGP
jgi:predicted ABC-type transport system involved in lysophospholipase L1 biosynthesis ATPase subunit